MTDNWDADSKAADSRPECFPLVVDLDGTLLRTDLLFESALRLIKQKPWLALLMPLWTLQGRAYLKRRVFQCTRIDVSLLPLNEELLRWLRDEKLRGRRLILATASDYEQARSLVEPLGLFDAVLGSDGKRNLKGRHKLKTIVEVCGKEFDYVGNSSSDLDIWRGCRRGVLVNPSRRVERAARRAGNVVRVFPSPASAFRDTLSALHWDRWVKNSLIFLPAITSHRIFDATVAGNTALAFLAFGFCASGVYILNDLLNLEEHRDNSTKRDRPLASGRMSIGACILLAFVCFSASAAIAAFVPYAFVTALIIYAVLASLYSLYLNRLLAVGALSLALLYTLRVVAGHLATGVPFSLWLLSFTFFLFLSLAFSKRATDLIQDQQDNETVVLDRGYATTEMNVVCIAGVGSGLLSCLPLALYINSDGVQLLYRRPALLWALEPIVLWYVTRLWVIRQRGELTEGPIQYLRALSPYAAVVLAVLVLLAASFDFTIFAP